MLFSTSVEVWGLFIYKDKIESLNSKTSLTELVTIVVLVTMTYRMSFIRGDNGQAGQSCSQIKISPINFIVFDLRQEGLQTDPRGGSSISSYANKSVCSKFNWPSTINVMTIVCCDLSVSSCHCQLKSSIHMVFSLDIPINTIIYSVFKGDKNQRDIIMKRDLSYFHKLLYLHKTL